MAVAGALFVYKGRVKVIIILPMVILAACLFIPALLEKRGIGVNYVYKIAFSLVSIMFITCLVVGILTLLDPYVDFPSGLFVLFLLFCAILSIPFVFVLGRRAFRKRTKEDVERVFYEGTEIAHDRIKKTSIGLHENAAGLLCYLLGWVGGTIFILIERENKFVRFHAIQSIIVLGVVTIIGFILHWWVGGSVYFYPNMFFLAIAFSLWVILMVKAFEGKRYKLPWAGKLAEKYA